MAFVPERLPSCPSHGDFGLGRQLALPAPGPVGCDLIVLSQPVAAAYITARVDGSGRHESTQGQGDVMQANRVEPVASCGQRVQDSSERLVRLLNARQYVALQGRPPSPHQTEASGGAAGSG